jgi:hypothetical protein
MGRLCFSTYVVDMKERDAPKSNSTTAEASLMKHILMKMSRASWASSTATWLTPTSVVLLHGNRNRIGSTGRGWCSCSGQISTSARIGASVGIMSLFTTVEAPTISLRQVLGSLGPLNIPPSSSWSVEIVGVQNHLALRSRESLSS